VPTSASHSPFAFYETPKAVDRRLSHSQGNCKTEEASMPLQGLPCDTVVRRCTQCVGGETSMSTTRLACLLAETKVTILSSRLPEASPAYEGQVDKAELNLLCHSGFDSRRSWADSSQSRPSPDQRQARHWGLELHTCLEGTGGLSAHL
jgi:hypothetical protein